ncbi:uncharacterized protein AMSG_09230 [Thecamonas trahens ATCC 50062]|uniref:Uncharacterized protein n=1 Tax=Thecamonas trahens ATCC 50062 TaxID=461836 RepID=A0A0L0DP16_THETB|nr:hypothetical protein AMSG_09230 [Thecamonas trahens ATCC 50062]KNC53153.1 hypothetical protein AMSG_09230 [Thecamonas trahens ATCC 50062]|eukprot:XP_013754626.1 hypothetical protein AMSG_09230 [Thecamonas trahens ATCC 50062]
MAEYPDMPWRVFKPVYRVLASKWREVELVTGAADGFGGNEVGDGMGDGIETGGVLPQRTRSAMLLALMSVAASQVVDALACRGLKSVLVALGGEEEDEDDEVSESSLDAEDGSIAAELAAVCGLEGKEVARVWDRLEMDAYSLWLSLASVDSIASARSLYPAFAKPHDVGSVFAAMSGWPVAGDGWDAEVTFDDEAAVVAAGDPYSAAARSAVGSIGVWQALKATPLAVVQRHASSYAILPSAWRAVSFEAVDGSGEHHVLEVWVNSGMADANTGVRTTRYGEARWTPHPATAFAHGVPQIIVDAGHQHRTRSQLSMLVLGWAHAACGTKAAIYAVGAAGDGDDASTVLEPLVSGPQSELKLVPCTTVWEEESEGGLSEAAVINAARVAREGYAAIFAELRG